MPYKKLYGKKYRKKQEDGETEAVRVTPLGHFIDNHIRLLTAIGTICVLLALGLVLDFAIGWANQGDPNEVKGSAIREEFLLALDNKSSPVVWNDFTGYGYSVRGDYEENGVRFQTREYQVEEGDEWMLLVGGNPDREQGIEYIRLYSMSDADILYEIGKDSGLSIFLKDHGKETK